MKKAIVTLIVLMVVPALYAGDGVVHKPSGPLVKDSYVVIFAGQGNPAARANELAATHGGQLNRVYSHALQGAHFLMNENQAAGMAHNPHVALVTQVYLAEIVGDQSNPTWGIDRIDERTLPDDNNYHWDFDGTGVNAYILDTGIRITHNDFGGRASWGTDCTGEGDYDGHGHGTHVA
ncbi:MAG: S8 family peptidase, partial [bacterium]|nr:S8 family peptidase [bacterium]